MEEEENPEQETLGVEIPTWALYVDGSSTTERSGAGLILTSPEGFVIQHTLRFKFRATNNEAEYEALLAGIRLANNLEIKIL